MFKRFYGGLFSFRSWIFDGFNSNTFCFTCPQSHHLDISIIEYRRSKTEGDGSYNVHLSRCSPVCNQELWRSALDMYCSGRWYFWKILVYHRQTSKYTLSNEICFKFLTQLIKKLWPAKICYFFAGHPVGDVSWLSVSLFLFLGPFL